MSSVGASDDHIRVRLAASAAELQRLAAAADLRDRGYLVAEMPADEFRNVRAEFADHGKEAALTGLLESLRGSEPGCPQAPTEAEFSPLEHRIGSLVMRGMTNRQVAARLHLAENTVRNYVSAMIQKLGVRNRTELAVHLAQSGER